MKRIHFVELEDLPWVPAAIRDGGTDLLDFFFAKIGFYKAAVPVFTQALQRAGGTHVVDLCSGGGGGAMYMAKVLKEAGNPAHFLLTDRHPNEAAVQRARMHTGVDYHPTAVDAANVPSNLPGLRTMFGALHHFKPEQIADLLLGCVAARAHIAFFDVAASPVARKVPAALMPLAALPNALVLFGLPFALVPFVRPYRASRFFLTYALPLVPALFAWDGTVSALRAYSPSELLAIARSVPGGDGHAWESDRAGPALYLTGTPR